MTASALAGALLVSRAAHAEPSAWVALGGGVLAWQDKLTPDFRIDPTMRIEAGIGIPDRFPVIVGGLFRISPMLSSNTGADMAWLARACTRGFQVGGFGIAADVGGYVRAWGKTSQGFEGSLSFGAPLGFAASFNVMAGSNDLLAFGGTVSIDILRLTLYRKTFLNWWPNPEVNTHKAPTASGPLGVAF
jgi:hypothetical protein